MLQTIRNASKGPIAWVIVILISIPFALFGVEQFFADHGHDPVIANLGDHQVLQSDYRYTLFQQQRALREQYGDAYENIDPARIQRAALNQTLSTGLAQAGAKDMGFAISNEQLRRAIGEDSRFTDDEGNFIREKYEVFLNFSGEVPSVFEERYRDQARLAQFYGALLDTNFATPTDRDTLFELLNHEREIAYLMIQWQDGITSDTVATDAEIADNYANNQAAYRFPEQVRIAYLESTIGRFIDDVELPEQAQIQAYFEDTIDTYTAPEQRRARHILVETLEEAERLLADMVSGADFAELAREHSLDTNSGRAGGDLGFFGRGVMVPSFEAAAFAGGIGEVSAPIESPFGYHIVEVTDIQAAIAPAYAEVADAVIANLRQELAFEQLQNLRLTWQEMLADNGGDLAATAAVLGEEVITSGWFDRNNTVANEGGVDAGMVENADIRALAFSNQVYGENGTSDAVLLGNALDEDDIANTRLVMLAITEKQAASTRPLSEVRDELEAGIMAAKARRALIAALNADIQTLRNDAANRSATWQAISARHTLNPLSAETPRWVAQNDEAMNIPSIREIYIQAYQLPREGLPAYRAFEVSDGHVVLLQLAATRPATENTEQRAESAVAMDNFQKSNLRFSMFEGLQLRYNIANINTDSLLQQ